jgi:mono/diheme cytochrome c family protein
MLTKSRISLLAVLATVFSSGCEKAMHDMYDQRKYGPLEPSDLFPDGRSSRPLPSGTVVRAGGALAGTSSGRRGERSIPLETGPVYPRGAQGEIHANLPRNAPETVPMANPLPMTQALLQHGRERFDIYCAPCHSPVGDGDGLVARRGFPHPPSYHTDRLRHAPDAHFFKVITHGYGAMYPYADRLSEEDRWAVVAYIRALQLSQHAALADVPEQARPQLEKAP